MIYENGALKEILLPEGYYQNGTFYYYLKDHLGDNRVTINSSGTVVEKSHYYPSGTRFFTESTSNDLKPLPYRYNGKELEAMNGLNQMDYGARRRFAGLPVWTGHDPLSEDYYDSSPYAYCLGNSMNNIDPFGMDVWSTTDPSTISEVYNALVNGKDVTYNENTWTHKTDEQFLKKGEDEGYSVGLNYSDKTGHFYLGTGISGGIAIKDLGEAKLNSDPDSHYGIDGCYNLYTKNETDAAMKFYWSIAGGELGGAALGAIGSRLLSGIAGRVAAETGSQLALGTTRMRLLNNVENPQLKKMIDFLYREGSKFGNGSTGSMIREELANGTITSASGSHLTKAQGALNSMRGVLNGNHGALSSGDRKIVFEIIEDLTKGTSLKW